MPSSISRGASCATRAPAIRPLFSLPEVMDAGTRIPLYTDGITEAMNAAREEFGKSRLKAFLSASSASASQFADALLLELRRWSSADAGRPQDDDITLLVLEVQ